MIESQCRRDDLTSERVPRHLMHAIAGRQRWVALVIGIAIGVLVATAWRGGVASPGGASSSDIVVMGTTAADIQQAEGLGASQDGVTGDVAGDSSAQLPYRGVGSLRGSPPTDETKGGSDSSDTRGDTSASGSRDSEGGSSAGSEPGGDTSAAKVNAGAATGSGDAPPTSSQSGSAGSGSSGSEATASSSHGASASGNGDGGVDDSTTVATEPSDAGPALCTSNPEAGSWNCRMGPVKQQESPTCFLRPPVWRPTACALEPTGDLSAAKAARVCDLVTRRWASVMFAGDSIIRELFEQVIGMLDTHSVPSRCWPLDAMRAHPKLPVCDGRGPQHFYMVKGKWEEKDQIRRVFEERMQRPGNHVFVLGGGLWFLKARRKQPVPNPPFWQFLQDIARMADPAEWRRVEGAHPEATMTVVFMPMHYRNGNNPELSQYWITQRNEIVAKLTKWGLDQLHAQSPIRNGWSGSVGDDVADRAPGTVSPERLGGRQGPGGVYVLDTWRFTQKVVEQCPLGKPPNAPGGTHLGPPGSRIKAQLLWNMLSEIMDGIDDRNSAGSSASP